MERNRKVERAVSIMCMKGGNVIGSVKQLVVTTCRAMDRESVLNVLAVSILIDYNILRPKTLPTGLRHIPWQTISTLAHLTGVAKSTASRGRHRRQRMRSRYHQYRH
jgi:hypothetical protein